MQHRWRCCRQRCQGLRSDNEPQVALVFACKGEVFMTNNRGQTKPPSTSLQGLFRKFPKALPQLPRPLSPNLWDPGLTESTLPGPKPKILQPQARKSNLVPEDPKKPWKFGRSERFVALQRLDPGSISSEQVRGTCFKVLAFKVL